MKSSVLGFLLFTGATQVWAISQIETCQDPNFREALLARTECFSGYSPSKCGVALRIAPTLEAIAAGAATGAAATRISHGNATQVEMQKISEQLGAINGKTKEFIATYRQMNKIMSIRDEKVIADKMFKVLDERGKLVRTLDDHLRGLHKPELLGLVNTEINFAQGELEMALSQVQRTRGDLSAEQKAQLDQEIKKWSEIVEKSKVRKTDLLNSAESEIHRRARGSSIKKGVGLGLAAGTAMSLADAGFALVENEQIKSCGMNPTPEAFPLIKKYAELDKKSCKLFVSPEQLRTLFSEDSSQIFQRAPELCSAMIYQLQDLKKRQESAQIETKMISCNPAAGTYEASVNINGKTYIENYRRTGDGQWLLNGSVFTAADAARAQQKATDPARYEFKLYMDQDGEWSSIQSRHLSFGALSSLASRPGDMAIYYQKAARCDFPKASDGLNSSPGQLVCGIGEQMVAANYAFYDVINCKGEGPLAGPKSDGAHPAAPTGSAK